MPLSVSLFDATCTCSHLYLARYGEMRSPLSCARSSKDYMKLACLKAAETHNSSNRCRAVFIS